MGSKNVTQSTKVELPDYAKPTAQDILGDANRLSYAIGSGAYKFPTHSTDEAFAPWNAYSQAAGNLYGAMGAHDTPAMKTSDTANTFAQGIMNGRYQNRPAPTNPYEGIFVEPEANRYGGDSNPYLDAVIAKGTGDITKAYSRGTAAQNDAAFARAGALGGSAYREQTANNEQNLADAIGNYSNQMRYQNYSKAQDLEESAINRALAADLQNVQRNAGLKESQIQRTNDNTNLSLQLGTTMAALAPGLAGIEKGIADSLMNYGQTQQAYDQGKYDYKLQQQDLNDPVMALLRALDIKSAGLASSVGNQSNVTSSAPASGVNPYAAGGGLAALAMWAKSQGMF